MQLAGNVLKGSNLDPQGQAQRHMMAARASNLAKQNVTVLPSAMGNPNVLSEQRFGPRVSLNNLDPDGGYTAIPIPRPHGDPVDPAVLRRMADEGKI